MLHPHALGLEVQGIRKSYGTHEVLRGVDLRAESGQILGLLGQSGAGKPTLITILCGLRRTSPGNISTCGHHPVSTEAVRSIGYAPQKLGIYLDLSIAQSLAASGELHGLGRREAASRTGEVMDLSGLTEKQDQRISHLSGGQQRRPHAGTVVMHHPRLVSMDEPTIGVDVEARSQILRVVRQLPDEGVAVVYTSYYLAEFEELGPDIVILNEGRIVASGTLEEVISGHGHAEVTLEFDCPVASFDGWNTDGRLLQHIGDEADPGSRIGEALAPPTFQGARLMNVRIRQASLHNAYLQTIKESDHVTA